MQYLSVLYLRNILASCNLLGGYVLVYIGLCVVLHVNCGLFIRYIVCMWRGCVQFSQISTANFSQERQ